MKQSRFMSSHFFHQRAISTEPGKKKKTCRSNNLWGLLTTLIMASALQPNLKPTAPTHKVWKETWIFYIYITYICICIIYLCIYLKKKTLWYICTHIYITNIYIYIHVKNARIWLIPNYVIFRGERHQRWSLDAPKNIQCHRIKWVPLGLGFPNQKDVIYKYTLPETNSKFVPVRKPGTPKGGSPSSSKFIPFLGGKTRC